MSRPAVERAAADLRKATATATACAPVRHELPSHDIDTAYVVQERNTELWLKEGRRKVGAKIGLTSADVQRQLGVSQPDFGALFHDMCYADGEEIPVHRLIQPRVEAEVALVLGHDLKHGPVTVVDMIQAIDCLLPAVEVVDSRIREWDIDIVDTVADNASSGVFVLGSTPVRPTDVDLRLAGMVLSRRGQPESTGAGVACLGHPFTAAAWLATTVAAHNQPLRQGDVVLTGALGPMVTACPGDVFDARISGLGSVRAVLGKEAGVD